VGTKHFVNSSAFLRPRAPPYPLQIPGGKVIVRIPRSEQKRFLCAKKHSQLQAGEDSTHSILSSDVVEAISRKHLTDRYATPHIDLVRNRHPAAAGAIGLGLSNLNGVDFTRPMPMNFGQDLQDLVMEKLDTLDPTEFQDGMKQNHPLAMEFIARLLRHTTHHNGLYCVTKLIHGCDETPSPSSKVSVRTERCHQFHQGDRAEISVQNLEAKPRNVQTAVSHCGFE
jgi:hypothetical protein